MNAPVLTYRVETAKPHAFADLDVVCTLDSVMTDEGEEVPAGTRGTVAAIYADGDAAEVEFEVGLATRGFRRDRPHILADALASQAMLHWAGDETPGLGITKHGRCEREARWPAS